MEPFEPPGHLLNPAYTYKNLKAQKSSVYGSINSKRSHMKNCSLVVTYTAHLTYVAKANSTMLFSILLFIYPLNVLILTWSTVDFLFDLYIMY